VGPFLEKMVKELNEGHTKNLEHVYRNFSLYCSPPEGPFLGVCRIA